MANFGRAYTWALNEKLTSALLNAEFDNIINNVTANGLNADNIDETDDYAWSGTSTFTGTVTMGVDDTGVDVKMFGASAGAFFLWDESADTQILRGATAAGAGTLNLSTGETTNVDGGILGRIDFQAPLDAAGTDAILVAASIWAEADATFSSSVNTTDLVFAAATSETATAVMRMKKGSLSPETTDGMSLGTTTLNWSDLFLDSGAVVDWNSGDVTLTHAAGKLTFGGDGAVELDFNNHEMTNVDINSGAIDGTIIGGASVAAGSFAAVVGTTGTFSGVLSVDDTTEATSTTTGSIHTDGGLGVAKDLILSSTSTIFLGDTANAKMTAGATLSQAGADNEILALKSSDVGHAMTALAEADTFATFTKYEAAAGGCVLNGYKDADGAASGALRCRGSLGEAADTSDTTASDGVVMISGVITDGGTGETGLAATGNLVSFDNADTTRFLIKGDGTMHATNITSGSGDLDGVALDGEDDIGLIRTFERTLHNDVGILMSRWDEQVEVHADDLKRVGVLSSEGHFYNMQRMNSLLGGGIWKNHTNIMELREALDERDQRIALLEAQVKGLIN